MNKIKALYALILLAVFPVFSLCSCNNDIKDEITQTIEGYLSALESHEADKIDSFLSEDLKIKNALEDENERAAAENHYFTIEDCELISIDFDKIERTDNTIKIVVEYKVTYSEDYIPTGSRKIGDNYLQEIFTLTEKNGAYIITDITSDLSLL